MCDEFKVVFPKDAPKGVPPRRMGYELKIDCQLDIAPIHQSIYELSPLELQEAKTQIESILKFGFILPFQYP